MGIKYLKEKMELTPEQEQAIKKGQRLKAFQWRNTDCEEKFDDVWFHVLHEVDLFYEGEDSNLNEESAGNARKWLKETQALTTEFKNTKID